MEELTPEEHSTIARYLAKPPRGRLDYLFASVTYLIPSFLFAIYGMWKTDFIAIGFAYLVLLIAMIYILTYQSQSALVFHSAIGKLMKNASAPAAVAGESG
jgi:hypothetical protein